MKKVYSTSNTACTYTLHAPSSCTSTQPLRLSAERESPLSDKVGPDHDPPCAGQKSVR